MMLYILFVNVLMVVYLTVLIKIHWNSCYMKEKLVKLLIADTCAFSFVKNTLVSDTKEFSLENIANFLYIIVFWEALQLSLTIYTDCKVVLRHCL